jgi:hypothetical protein
VTRSDASELAGRRFFAPVREAATGGHWKQRLDRAIGALLEGAAAEPGRATLCLIPNGHAFVHESPGHRIGADILIEVLADARREASRRDEQEKRGPPAITESFLADGILALVEQRLAAGDAQSLPHVRAELLALASHPFMGE